MTSKMPPSDSLAADSIDADATSAVVPVLRLRSVTLTGLDDPTFNVSGVDWELPDRHLAVVHLDRSQHPRGFASVLQGILPVQSGDIQFCGVSWGQRDVASQCRRRGKIGRVFEQDAWINNLNIRENVLLRAEQVGIAVEPLNEEIERLRLRLEVPPLTRERPAFVESPRLQRFQWLRAFLGRPKLLILERPLKSLQTNTLACLLPAVEALVASGSSVLWFAGTQPECEFRTRVPCSRWLADSDGIRPASESASADIQTETKSLDDDSQRRETSDG